jgi:hypothetical protein
MFQNIMDELEFFHWFLASIYEVSKYTIHSLHEVTTYVGVYL